MIFFLPTLQRTFAALRSPNYRLWFAGQLVSLVGTWMQMTAQSYLVYDLTRSTAFLGYVGFATGLPTWLFMLYGGVLADRLPRRTLLMITQAAMMVPALVLAALVATGRVAPWHIVATAFCLGVANSFDAPARQAFVVELVDKDDLTNAIALNSMMFNSAVVVGPAVAAGVYAALGPAWCFAVNGLSFLAVIAALWRMRIERPAIRTSRRSALSQLREGLAYTADHPAIRTLIANLGLLSLFGISLLTLLPAWSVEILHGDIRTNGILLSSRGVGAVLGGLMIAWLGGRRGRGRVWTAGGLAMPLALVWFAVVRSVPLSALAMLVTGWAFMTQANTSNALVQTRVQDELRGRVMSIYALVFLGFMPVGSLLVGTLADWLGEPVTVLAGAALLWVVAMWIWVRLPFIRRLP